MSNANLLLFAFLVNFVSSQSFALEADLSRYKGQVVYLDFWASWCSPCRKSFPFMNELVEQYSGKGLSIVSVNLDENRADAAQFLRESPANFDVIYDTEGILARQYQLKGMPTSFLFDSTGKLFKTHIGFKKQDRAKIRADIDSLLKIWDSQ